METSVTPISEPFSLSRFQRTYTNVLLPYYARAALGDDPSKLQALVEDDLMLTYRLAAAHLAWRSVCQAGWFLAADVVGLAALSETGGGVAGMVVGVGALIGFGAASLICFGRHLACRNIAEDPLTYSDGASTGAEKIIYLDACDRASLHIQNFAAKEIRGTPSTSSPFASPGWF